MIFVFLLEYLDHQCDKGINHPQELTPDSSKEKSQNIKVKQGLKYFI
jgi:hypothetical protein